MGRYLRKDRRKRMKEFQYKTHGVCSREIHFFIDDEGKVRNVRFIGGCNGNTQGVSSLVERMDAKDAAKRLAGINCNMKGTSCPDQLSRAITEALEDKEN